MMARGGGPGGQGGAQASIVILDAAGDTVQTLNGPATAGINRAYWNLNRRGDQSEMSPSERADSVRNAQLYGQVGDSLVANEGVDRGVMDQVLEMAQGGNQGAIRRMFGGRGGGEQGDPGAWRDRPGESYPESGGAAGRGRGPGAQGGPGGGDPGAMREVFQQFMGALRDRGAGGFRRFFGGGRGSIRTRP